MSEIINMHHAKTTLSRLVERALGGEEIVIARDGEPLVKLVPVPKTRSPACGELEGQDLDCPRLFRSDEPTRQTRC
jgi:prevent-host-death family protein